jgi:hypothetical protein
MMVWPRRNIKAARPIFEDAFKAIDNMEAAVVYRTVTVDCTLKDVVRWLWPDHVTEKLYAAYPLARFAPDQHNEGAYVLGTHGPRCKFHFKVEDIELLAPHSGLWEIDVSREEPMLGALTEVAHIHSEFNKVREVVTWMNNYATVGAARFYFPGLSALLPNGHVFHCADGLRYKEPAMDMTDINPLIRQAGVIIASGILANPGGVDNQYHSWGVTFHSPKNNDIMSQRFMLI